MVCKAKLNDEGTHCVLNGEKMWVTNGSSADIYVLFAKDVDHPEYGVKKHGGITALSSRRIRGILGWEEGR